MESSFVVEITESALEQVDELDSKTITQPEQSKWAEGSFHAAPVDLALSYVALAPQPTVKTLLSDISDISYWSAARG